MAFPPRHIGLLLLLAAIPSSLIAQTFGQDSHTVTIQVPQVTTLQVAGGPLTLNMANAIVTAGEDMMVITDETSQLRWGTNESGRKVTVETDLTSPLFSMRIRAVNPSVGTAWAEVVLSTSPENLLLDIGRSSGSCMLRYTGVAYASQGTGTDNHLVTFTIQTQ